MITLQERVHGTPTPDGWTLNKLHRVFRVRKGYKNIGMREDNLLSLSYGNIINKDIDSADGLLPESFETYQIVEPGNIVMRLTDLQNDKRSLRQGLVKERGIITSAYDALELESGHDPRFWSYALLALDLAKYYYSMGGGVRQSIKFADFPNDWLATPDQAGQRAIADFLDDEVARIDSLIGKKQRLVELLSERRTSTVSEALFEGNGPSLQRLRFWITLNPSHRERRVSDDAMVTFAPMEAISDGLGGLDLSNTRPFSDVAGASYNYFAEGDLLLAKVTPCFENGKKAIATGLSNGVGFATSEVFVIRPDTTKLNRRYLSYLFSTAQFRAAGIASMTGAGGLRRISDNAIRDFMVPNLSLGEQEKIAERLGKVLQRQAVAHEKTVVSIDRLQEYRSALITAAVTGGINLEDWRSRGHSDRLLDEIQEAMGE